MAKDNKKALIVKKLADKRGVSTSYIYKVLNGERDNDDLVSDYMTIKEEVDNALLNAVNSLVPFSNTITNSRP